MADVPQDDKAKKPDPKAGDDKGKKPDEKPVDDKGKKKDDEETATETDDDPGELGTVFDEDEPEDETDDEPEPDKKGKPGALKVSVPKEIAELVGDAKDYLAAAREAGLSQKQLDRFMAVHFDRVKSAAQGMTEATEQKTLGWRRNLMRDPELGGEKLKETMLTADRGARALGGSTLAAKLARHLRGEEEIDGPTLIRAFHMAGLELKEDRLGDSKKPTPKDADANLTPAEREFKKTHPETWKRMQDEKASNRSA